MPLPTPSCDAQARSNKLKEYILSQIAQQGALSFASYMEMALYTEALGYYHSNDDPFGPAGDFVTSPTMSPLFAQTLANQCAEILISLQNGDCLELGAGNGQLAYDLMTALDELGVLPGKYFIVERSDAQKTRQEQLFAQLPQHLAKRIIWLKQLPEQFSGLVIGNEVLDAQGHERWQADFLQWLVVDGGAGQLAWAQRPAQGALREALEILTEQLPFTLAPGYCSEININWQAFFTPLYNSLNQAVVLLIDYGYTRETYYHPERGQGTLRCFYRHHMHEDPLLYPGLQDISCHVDFQAVAQAATGAGFVVSGYNTQARFLLNCGLLDCALKAMQTGSPAQQHQISQVVQTLTAPQDMGELCKVMALSKFYEQDLLGFSSVLMGVGRP